MAFNGVVNKTFKVALLASAVAVSGTVSPAIAQDSDKVEKVTVTGSRIKQKGLVSQSPVTTVGDQVISYQGSPDITSTLNNLPAVNVTQDRSVGALSDGTATVDLRAQGAARTLVLINGQRLMPGDPLQASPAADLNAIPTAMVQRIEVVTGGASAVYGSDAMAGVVNFIMKKDFSGIQLDVSGGTHQSGNDDADAIRRLNDASFAVPKKNIWDGQEFSADLIMGANTPDGKGNVTMYVGYQDVDAISGAARPGLACAYAEDGAGDLICLASSNYARIIPLSGYKADGDPDDGDYFFGGGPFVPFAGTPAQTYNFAPFNLAQRADTRFKAGAFAHYDITDSIELYASAMYFKDRSPVTVAPSGSFLQTGTVDINCDNPLMTDAQADLLGCMNIEGNLASGRQTNDVTVLLGRRNIEGGPRQTPLEHSQIRFAGGVRGTFSDAWDYDVSAVYGETNYQQTYFNDWSATRKARALQVDPITGNCKTFDLGIDLQCVPLNIFTGLGGLDQAMIDYVSASPIIVGQITQAIVNAEVTGDLAPYGVQLPWAQTGVQVAFGAEYRRDTLNYLPSSDWSAGDLEGNSTKYSLTDASLDVAELFAETTIPIVEDKPFFKLLQLNAGYRKSDFSTSAGVINTYKYGLEWAPVSDVRFRGSFQAATRAPGLLELFGAQGFGLTAGFDDLCSTDFDAGDPNRPTDAQCLATGMTQPQIDAAKLAGTGAGPKNCISGQCSTITGGNPNLQSETAETISFGFVFTPTFFKGFNLTVDYYDIDITDFISPGVNPTTIFNQCITVGALCGLIHRDATGSLLIKGFGFDQSNLNIGRQNAVGIDIESNLRVDFDDVGIKDAGALSLAFLGTKQIDQIIVDVAAGNVGIRDCVGQFGLTCGTPYFEWRHQLRATWNTPWDLDLSLNWRHLSSVFNDRNSTDPNIKAGTPSLADIEIPSFDYLDIAGKFSINENYELTFGMTNVFDKDPPLLDQNDDVAGNALNTPNSSYDTTGRFMFVTGTVRY